MTEQKKNVNVRVKLFSKDGYRAAFPHLFEPWKQDSEDDVTKAKYQVLICLDKETDKKAIKQVNDAAKEVVTEFWGKDSVKKLGVSIGSPLVDGEKKDKYENLQYYYTISAKLSGYDKKGNLRKPPKMMAVHNGRQYTPDHKDWSEDMMMTGRYCFIISLYTSTGANRQGNKVCASLESIMALPPVEGDEEEVMPGFGGIQSGVEDDFADMLSELGVESPSDDFDDSEDDDLVDEDLDEDLDAELDSEDEPEDDEDLEESEDDSEDEDPEPEPAPKKRRGRPAKKAVESKTEAKPATARKRTRRARTSVE